MSQSGSSKSLEQPNESQRKSESESEKEVISESSCANDQPNIPTYFVILPQLRLAHPVQVIPRERAQQQIALERAALARLVHQPCPERLDGLVRSGQTLRECTVVCSSCLGEMFRRVREGPRVCVQPR